jgi:O-antigen biosynthesis protein
MEQQTFFDSLKANTSRSPFFVPDLPSARGPDKPKVQLVAFYLPQFHPIPENDDWWGRGFTEWTNVTRALPRFAGHVQPRLPADLGFYNLRDPQIIREQARLARRYGVGGFCFHHYWFNGRRLLETPLNIFLADPSIDMPFCINWANENWTRRWDGLDSEVLLGQTHSPEDDDAFAQSLLPIVRDRRYIRVNGRPLVMIYRPSLLPNSVATMRRWRAAFMRASEDNPYIVMAQSFGDEDPRIHGVDAAAEFPPHKFWSTPPITGRITRFDDKFEGIVVEYGDLAKVAMEAPAVPFKVFRGVAPSWDNEARKPGCGFTLSNSTPAAYGDWLTAACRATIAEAAHADERIVFINAWNEWGEGAYLEPDRHFGHAYLAATASALASLETEPDRIARKQGRSLRLALISHDAHKYGAQALALALARSMTRIPNLELNILIGGAGALVPEFEALAPTRVVPGDFGDPEAWREAAKWLVASGCTAALCNTLVSGRAIPQLRERGLRIVQLVHELPSLIRQYGLEAASREAAATADVMVFPSVFVRDRFVELAGPIRGQTVIRPQGLYMPMLSPKERTDRRAATRRMLGISDAKRMVLGVAHGDTRKGLDLWPLLIRRVAEKCPEAIFVWVGKTEPNLRHWLDHDLLELGLEGRLILPGPTEQLTSFYAAADAFVLTSREDPFPNVGIEAVANGLSVFMFDGSSGIVQFVRKAGGVVVPYLDINAMGDALCQLFTEPSTKADDSLRLERVRRDFKFADYVAELVALAAPWSPTVSVIVPNYNYARHLRRRLESIWAQSVPVFELIVLDDDSTDESAQVIEELRRESPVEMRVVRNQENSGSVSRQWARGVRLARGEVVWIAEADDFAEPEFLEGVAPAFEDSDIVLSYCESRMVNEAGEVTAPDYLGYVSDIDSTRWKVDFRAFGPDEVATTMAIKNTIPNVSAALFRRTALVAVLDEHLDAMTELKNAGDWLCYIRLLQRGGRIEFTSRVLNNHRRHNASVTTSEADERHLQEIAAMQDLAASVVSVEPKIREAALAYRQKIADQFGIM